MFSHKPVLSMRVIAIIAALTIQASAQQRQAPDVQAQREHMAKLEFLAGKWTGEGFVTEGPGEAVRIIQSESIQFKLNGLVLLLEGQDAIPKLGRFFSALSPRFHMIRRLNYTGFALTAAGAISRLN